MLITIPLLTSIIFASIYPLCFWISWKDPLKNDFHKFHIGLPNFIGGVGVVGLIFMDVPVFLKINAVIWKIFFLSVSRYYWKKGTVNPFVITIPCVIGSFIFSLLLMQLVMKPLMPTISSHFLSFSSIILGGILGGFVFCLSLYTMNLGHWYLNVHGLPISHIRRAVYVF